MTGPKIFLTTLIFSVVFITFVFAIPSSAAFQKYEFVERWGSNGSGDGQFDVPHSMVFDKSGNVYITDTHNNRVQKFSSDGEFITKWGSEGSGDGQFVLPLGIGVDSYDNVYVVDQGTISVQQFSNNGSFISKMKINQTAQDRSTVLEDIEFNKSDDLLLTDRGQHNIIIYNLVQ